MKTIAIALTTALLLAPALTRADSAVDAYCQSLGSLSEAIMHARQVGVPLENALRIAETAEEDRDLMRSIVLAAYAETRYSTDRIREEVASEFGIQQHLACLRIMTDA